MAELLPLVLIFGVVYLVMIRPQQKRQAEIVAMMSSLREDDDVITTGGLFGTIVAVNETSVDLQVSADGLVLRFQKGAIAKVVPDTEDSDDVDAWDDDSADSADATIALEPVADAMVDQDASSESTTS